MIYGKGIVFVILYIFMIYIFGTGVAEKRSAPERFLIGYILYSAFSAVVGIPVQVLGLPWKAYFIYQMTLDIAILLYGLIRIRRHRIRIFEESISGFIRNYWFLAAVSAAMVVLSLTENSAFWMNNKLDDGYYITKMEVFPYASNPFRLNYSVGIPESDAKIWLDSRIFTTFELEGSCYLYILKIYSTVFARCFLALIGYFVFACSIYSFGRFVCEKGNAKIDRRWYQFFAAVMLIFALSGDKLAEDNIFFLQDEWQLSTAMYFGSALVRTAGMLWVTQFALESKLSVKSVLKYIVLALALMSKSATALPMLLVTAVIFLGIALFRRKKIVCLGYAALIVCAAVFLRNDAKISSMVSSQTIGILRSVLIITLIIPALFALKRGIYAKIAVYLFLNLLLSCLEPVNNLFEKFSVYDFVAARYLAGVIIFALVYAFILLLGSVIRFLAPRAGHPAAGTLVLSAITAAACFGVLVYNNDTFAGAMEEYDFFSENSYYAPDDVVNLGNELTRLQREKGQIVAIMPEGALIEDKAYMLAVSIRQFAPEIVSLSALNRYGGNADPAYKDLTFEFQTLYYDFVEAPDETRARNFEAYIGQYPVNCIIMTSTNTDSYLREMGYQLESTVYDHVSFYIYTRALA